MPAREQSPLAPTIDAMPAWTGPEHPTDLSVELSWGHRTEDMMRPVCIGIVTATALLAAGASHAGAQGAPHPPPGYGPLPFAYGPPPGYGLHPEYGQPPSGYEASPYAYGSPGSGPPPHYGPPSGYLPPPYPYGLSPGYGSPRADEPSPYAYGPPPGLGSHLPYWPRPEYGPPPRSHEPPPLAIPGTQTHPNARRVI
jgi:hypothetical protein